MLARDIALITALCSRWYRLRSLLTPSPPILDGVRTLWSLTANYSNPVSTSNDYVVLGLPLVGASSLSYD